MGSIVTTPGQAVEPERALGRALLHLLKASRAQPETMDDLGRSARLLLQEAERLLPGSRCRITAIGRQGGGTMRVLAASSGSRALSEREFRLEETPSDWVRESQVAVERTLRRGDPSLHPELVPWEQSTVRAVPLRAPPGPGGPGSVLGAFVVEREGPSPFSEPERTVIDVYGMLVAVSLNQAELRREAVRQTQRLEMGVDLALDLARSLEPADVLRRLLERATAVGRAERAAVLRVEGETFVVEGAHDAEGMSPGEGTRVPLGRFPDELRALRSRAAVTGGAPPSDELTADVHEALGTIRQRLILPLIIAGEVVGLLTVSRRRDEPFTPEDVTTLQMIANLAVLALRNARLYGEAQAARERMSSFLDLVIHELRSPLTVIAGYIDMLARGGISGEPALRDRALETVASKIEEMQGLVNELVRSVRLASGSAESQISPVDLCDAARRALERARPRARMVEAHLQADLPAHPVGVMCDPSNIDHILDNLINNALSYGGVRPEICVSVEPDGRSVAVTDHGPGISPELHEKVFERFFRVNPLHQQMGSGMGLHLSRQLAAQCGGTLAVDYSDPIRGTRFVLQLPPSSPAPPSG